MSLLKNIITLLRPHQWAKSIFVFAGLFFAEEFDDSQMILNVLLAAIAFALMSSSVYVMNDIADCEKDRHHPIKCRRPLPSGQISQGQAIIIGVVLNLISLSIAWTVGPIIVLLLICYFIINVAYSFRLKHVVLLDVFCIASGFMLRLLAGTIGVNIPPSKWLLFCGLMLTLFLGFCKRRAELSLGTAHKTSHRFVLDSYSNHLLDQIIAICATGVIISYSLYTMNQETIAVHHTENLITTVPFVTYALFRYIFLIQHGSKGENPTRDLFLDRHMILAMTLWLALTTFLFVYSPSSF